METQDNPHRRARETFLTLSLTVLFAGGFMAILNFLTFGVLTHVIAVAIVIGVVGTFHYVLWGQALSQEVAAERQEEELHSAARRTTNTSVRRPGRPVLNARSPERKGTRRAGSVTRLPPGPGERGPAVRCSARSWRPVRR